MRRCFFSFKLQPNQSLCFRGEAGAFFLLNCNPTKACASEVKRVSAEKTASRVTAFLCCNADGLENMKLMVMGRSQKPRCSKNTGSLPCMYKANKKAWMTAKFFRKFLTQFDRKMACKNGQFALHRPVLCLPERGSPTSCESGFLPENATSRLQPLDAGIINNVKHHFKVMLVQQLLDKINQKD